MIDWKDPGLDWKALVLDWKAIDLDGALAVFRKAGWRVTLTGSAVLLACGEIVAIEVTAEGRDAMERLEHAHGALPKTLEIALDEGVRLRLYRSPGHLSTTVGLHGTAPGVSILAAGREIPLPPSRDGRRMASFPRRREPTKLAELERIPELPDWLFRAGVDSIAARALWTGASKSDAQGVFPCTDVGNAERLARSHGADLRWIEAWGTWLAWDGRRWSRDDTGEVVRRAVDTVRQIGAEAAACEHEGQRKALLQWALKSEAAGRVNAMVQLARAQPGLAARPEQFDTDPWVLNCQNGTLDLRTGTLREHRRAELITKLCPVAYDPEARSEEFERFFARVQPVAEVRAYLQRFLGYACTGVIREHVFPIWHGTGRNGKGTLTDAVRAALGPYATEIPTELLTARRNDAHPTERATLFGARFATASETEKDCHLAVALVKRMTGGDVIKARYVNENFFEFEPTHKLMLQTNNRPIIQETSNAIWDRVHLVQWGVRIPDDERDGGLRDRLKTDARAAVLAWLVRGCLDWQKPQGLNPPESVKVATREYAAESDPFAGFLAACVTREPDPFSQRDRPKVLAGALFAAYQSWCRAQDTEPETQTAFGRAMNGRDGVEKKKNGNGYPEYRGIRLFTDEETRAGAPPEGEPEGTDGYGGPPGSTAHAPAHGGLFQ